MPQKTMGKPLTEEAAPATQQGKRRTRPAAGYRLTPTVEAALAEAAAELPLPPAAIVDTAVRDWLRAWRPGIL